MERNARKSELVTFRAASEDIGALRLICQATGTSMAEEIRTGIKSRIDLLSDDEDVQTAVGEYRQRLERLYGSIEFIPSPEASTD